MRSPGARHPGTSFAVARRRSPSHRIVQRRLRRIDDVAHVIDAAGVEVAVIDAPGADVPVANAGFCA
jgi:Holliday junction resolvasome RuvABC ATP-dependent DNA helicase subunit